MRIDFLDILGIMGLAIACTGVYRLFGLDVLLVAVGIVIFYTALKLSRFK